jgi:hypothetical protein
MANAFTNKPGGGQNSQDWVGGQPPQALVLTQPPVTAGTRTWQGPTATLPNPSLPPGLGGGSGKGLKYDLPKSCFQGEVITWQPIGTFFGATGSPQMVQPAGQWLHGLNFASYLLKAELMHLTGCTLVIESALTVEGPWTTVATLAAAGSTEAILSSEGGPTVFSNHVRWRVEPGAGAWSLCFKLVAVPGQSINQPLGSPKKL